MILVCVDKGSLCRLPYIVYISDRLIQRANLQKAIFGVKKLMFQAGCVNAGTRCIIIMTRVREKTNVSDQMRQCQLRET